MDAATLQNRIYKGYAKAASRIGYSASQYRPGTEANPLGALNLLRTLPASFNAEDFKYAKANKYGHPTWFGVFDGTLTQAGDYLVSAQDGTFFIAAQQTNLPILLVACNRSLRVSRQSSTSAVGAVGYSGSTAGNETNILGAPGALWPASILFGGKQQVGLGLPAGSKQVGWQILLPVSVPGSVLLTASDIVSDDIGRRYVIDGAELTDLGWRVNANELHT